MLSSRQILCLFIIVSAFLLWGNALPSALAVTDATIPNQSEAASLAPGSLKQLPVELNIEPLAWWGDWLYYLRPCNPYKWQQAELYRVKNNGGSTQKIIPQPLGPARDIRFVNGWIYYIKPGTNAGLFRIRPDGSGYTQLTGRINSYEIREPYVFYEYVDGLYRIDTEGKNRIPLDTGVSDYYVSRIEKIEGAWLYYQRVTSEHTDPTEPSITHFTYGLYRIKLDGSQKSRVIEENLRGGNAAKAYPTPLCLVIAGDEIFYAAPHNRDGAIFAVKTDGSGRRLVCTNTEAPKPNIMEIYSNNQWIYYKYSYGIEKYCVNKVRKNGTEKTRLKADFHLQLYPDEYEIAQALCTNANIDGGWVYYSTRHKIYRIKTDHTEKSLIYDAGSQDIGWLNLRGDYLYFNCFAKNNKYNETIYRCKVKVDGSIFAQLEAQ